MSKRFRRQRPRSDFVVLLATFGLTVLFDLTIGVGRAWPWRWCSLCGAWRN
jgi:MFS superfamily sulfate permease-like transporter